MEKVFYTIEKNQQPGPSGISNGINIKPYFTINNQKKYSNIFNINDNVNYLICSAPKTASTTFWQNIIRKKGMWFYKINNKYELSGLHSHSTQTLKRRLNQSNQFIITLIRNPIDMNLSNYMHLLFKWRNDSKKINSNKLQNMNINEIITGFFNKTKPNIIKWYQDFFKITKIKSFDKSKGYQLYDLDNNNKLLLIVLEKMDKNTKEILNILNLKSLEKYNTHSQKTYNNISNMKYLSGDISNKINYDYKKLYQDMKNNIEYNPQYVDLFLNNEIIDFFYTKKDINNFKNKININKNIEFINQKFFEL